MFQISENLLNSLGGLEALSAVFSKVYRKCNNKEHILLKMIPNVSVFLQLKGKKKINYCDPGPFKVFFPLLKENINIDPGPFIKSST